MWTRDFVADADSDAKDIVKVHAEIGKIDEPLVPRGFINVLKIFFFGPSAVKDLRARTAGVGQLYPQRLGRCVTDFAVEL